MKVNVTRSFDVTEYSSRVTDRCHLPDHMVTTPTATGARVYSLYCINSCLLAETKFYISRFHTRNNGFQYFSRKVFMLELYFIYL